MIIGTRKMMLFCFTLFIIVQSLFGAISDDTSLSDHIQNVQNGNKKRWKLIISPLPDPIGKLLIKKTDETLNLTCRVQKFEIIDEDNLNFENSELLNYTHFENSEENFKLAWYLPNTLENSKNRVINSENGNSLQLIVQNLRDSDAGEYKCTAHEASDELEPLHFSGSLNVQIKPKSKAALGKLSPCEKLIDINCSLHPLHSCCTHFQSFQLSVNVSHLQKSTHYNDMGLLQTTIYTVIGCAMAFMFIITVMVIAICRVQLKRTGLSRYHLASGSNSAPFRQQYDSWGNVYLQSAAPGLLLAYNVENGIEFLGGPCNPPPYSETHPHSPHIIHGPPPPYTSTQNLNNCSNLDLSPNLTNNLELNSTPNDNLAHSSNSNDNLVHDSISNDNLAHESTLSDNLEHNSSSNYNLKNNSNTCLNLQKVSTSMSKSINNLELDNNSSSSSNISIFMPNFNSKRNLGVHSSTSSNLILESNLDKNSSSLNQKSLIHISDPVSPHLLNSNLNSNDDNFKKCSKSPNLQSTSKSSLKSNLNVNGSSSLEDLADCELEPHESDGLISKNLK